MVADLSLIMDKREQDQFLQPHCSLCNSVKESWEHLREGSDHEFVTYHIEYPHRRCHCFACRVERDMAFHESSMMKYSKELEKSENMVYRRSIEYHATRMAWLKTL